MSRLGSWLLAPAAMAAIALSASAQAPIVRTVLNNGAAANCYDIVILGDGYQASQQARFDQDVNAFLTGLFQRAPYSTFASYFNVHTVFRASQDAGASHPDASPPIVRNTAYGASYNTGGTARCLYITNTSRANQDAALAPANESRVLVMVNDSRYGGCAGTFAVSYNGTSMVEVQAHEFGHAIGRIADEYDYPNGTYTGNEPGQPNITAQPTGQKWSQWWGTESVSAFEGAGYYLRGLWRPKSNCLMRNLGVAHCPVCREAIVKQLNSVVDVIDSTSPATQQVTMNLSASQTFSFTHRIPAGNPTAITWRVDGAVVAGQNGASFVFDSTVFGGGPHTVTAEVRDLTPLVRSDPSGVMTHSYGWSVVVVDPNLVDLRLSGASVSTTSLVPGQQVDLTVTVHNDGPGTASNVKVEHFLSLNGTVETTDLYLGSSVVASLPPGSNVLQRRVTLPAMFDAAAFYLVIAVVDREGQIHESNELNNQAITVQFIAPPPCFDRLEFRDDLLYPRDRAELAVGTGGTVSPTVVSPCRTAAPTLYVIVWGCSGTQPGTVLAPGIVVPINADPCTNLALGALNGQIFQGFWGLLDGEGVGRATLNWPANLAASGFTSWFGAALLDTSTSSFVAATNPITFVLN